MTATEHTLLNEADWHGKAFTGSWTATPYETRAAIFRKAARIVEENGEEFAGWIIRETGAVAPKADVELHMAAGILYQSSALATGNAVILKPDLRTPVSGGFLLARVFEEAGLPAGLLHVLPGGAEAGEAMCRDPHIAMIAFTGSTANGRKVGALAGEHLKKVSLELGGKNSIIILDDADLDAAASNARWGAWLHQGQICMTAGRILVHEKVAGALVEKLVQVADALPVGDPAGRNVALGPLINETQLPRVHG